MHEFRMPSLGADMEAGTLVQWLKQPGETLARGDIMAVVDTHKGAIEIEVFEDGVLDRLIVSPGEKVPVGSVLALIRTPGEAPSEAPAAAVSAGVPTPAPLRVSPGARQAARELQVDLSSVSGSGPGGAITRADVERTSGRERPVAAAPTGIRHDIAAAMSRSKREIPHLYLATTVDMTQALSWLEAENGKRDVEHRLLPVALLLKAVALAVKDVPAVNGFWVDGGFKAGAGVHLGCAVALRAGGLVAPALHDVDRKDLDTVMRELVDVTMRARQGTLRSSELSDPTLTVTNLGDLGVEEAYAVIYPPQVAIVAFGRMMQRPWIFDGRIEARTTLRASVSADHRALDGRSAGQFLAAIDRWLSRPEQL